MRCRSPATPLSWDSIRGQQAMVLNHGMVCCRMHGQRAFPSPMGRPAISKPMRTPSPKQRHPSGMFGLAQTPVHASLAQGIPSTPISGAMSAAAWLQDVATRGPAQVQLTSLTVLRPDVTCQLMLGQWGVACQAAMWSAGLGAMQAAWRFKSQPIAYYLAYLQWVCGMH